MVAEVESNSDPALLVENLEERIAQAFRERRIEDADRYIAQLNGFVSLYVPIEKIQEPIHLQRIPDPQPILESLIIAILVFLAVVALF